MENGVESGVEIGMECGERRAESGNWSVESRLRRVLRKGERKVAK